ncbi:NUDIX domain-containing protein [Clostridium sp. C2-6-12]|uniref:bis(5'-nucleosyl)-tetraphosphatase n=1 Tax=Clostridium sp. C2-6-12 TaxID=2698832 RepID=UPI00136B2CF3|nr:NUDIX domain-containing protein [Clostridium sp. C2-6-12]
MKYEVSCGAIVFTRKDNEIYFAIVKSLEGFYGFPKGHIEGNETEEETALREIYEEIGIKPQIIAGFRTTDEHTIPNKNDVIKRIVYFLAEYDNQQIRYQEEELEGAYLMTYKEAMDAFQFESSKRILNEVREFISF